MDQPSSSPDRTLARVCLGLLAACGVVFTFVVLTRLRGLPPVPKVLIIVFEWLVLGLVARMLLRPRAGGGR